jgi:predicted nucleic acid-binding protein
VTYLVDANVLSEPTKAQPNANVVQWLSVHEGDLVVDPIVLGEIRLGVLVLQSGQKRRRLVRWLATVEELVGCLPWDAAVSRRWAELVAALRRKGRALPLLDSMIAATALEHGLIVATRNVRDFRKAGVKVVDPFLPSAGV